MNLDFGKSVPDLRFKDGQGEEYPEWEETQLGRLFNISAGGDIEKSNVRKTKSDKFRFPVYANSIKNKGIQGYSHLYRVDKECITVSGRGTLGVAHARTGKFCPIVRLLVLISKSMCDLYFFEYAINELRIFNESTGVPQLTAPQLNKYRISYPILEEQQKIANFLFSVDTRIEQLEKKKALLEQYKKGLMQKLFSQETRFKDDQGEEYPEWVEKVLNRVVDIKKGQQLNRDEMILGGNFPVINGGVVASGYTDSHNFKGNVITVSEGGNSCGYVGWQRKDFWLGGHCYALPVSSPSMDPDYLFYYLKNIEEQIMRLRVGSGLPNIQKRDLGELTISFPQVEEQQKIANFISSVDKKIELIAEQVSQTRDFKKGLLQQMFV